MAHIIYWTLPNVTLGTSSKKGHRARISLLDKKSLDRVLFEGTFWRLRGKIGKKYVMEMKCYVLL